jgi:GWxTD domain-containing protein
MLPRILIFCVCPLAALYAAAPTWLDQVLPVITPAEKKTYLALPPGDRTNFEQNFWATRAIAKEEYYRRLQHVDATWGSDKPGSGVNTDPGRVYLSLGAPNRLTRLPSSRNFVPLEVWYYDTVPGILNTELHLIFYRQASLGLPKLYSPTVDTIRALLVPQAGTAHMFGPNDSLTESDIRRNLKTGPAEDEVITAATGIAAGIKYSGHDAILGQITSPEFMLSKPLQARVASRLITAHPQFDTLLTPSPYGGVQVDLRFETAARRDVELEVLNGAVPVSRNRLGLNFSLSKTIEYTHRLDLLPGAYRLIFTVDGVPFAYPLEVPEKIAMSAIVRTGLDSDVTRSRTPFGFERKRVSLTPQGRFAAVTIAEPGKVTWIVRQGSQVKWRTSTEATNLAVVELPQNLPPGQYRLEAIATNDSRSADLILPVPNSPESDTTAISYNANLTPSQRLTFIGHQWLLRGDVAAASRALEASLQHGPTTEAQIELARAETLSGKLDPARDRLRRILDVQPGNFEALAVYAHIETRLQDYSVAAEFYRRALAVQDSPELRAALATLPVN